MTRDELDEVLRKHKLWLAGEDGGERAKLAGADLTGANIDGADFSCASMDGVKR